MEEEIKDLHETIDALRNKNMLLQQHYDTLKKEYEDMKDRVVSSQHYAKKIVEFCTFNQE